MFRGPFPLLASRVTRSNPVQQRAPTPRRCCFNPAFPFVVIKIVHIHTYRKQDCAITRWIFTGIVFLPFLFSLYSLFSIRWEEFTRVDGNGNEWNNSLVGETSFLKIMKRVRGFRNHVAGWNNWGDIFLFFLFFFSSLRSLEKGNFVGVSEMKWFARSEGFLKLKRVLRVEGVFFLSVFGIFCC